MTAPVIEIKGLCVQAGHTRILEVAEFAVAAGELVGVLGPNGAGKSTLLRCLLGMQRHATGGVRMFGQELGTLGWAGLARLRRRIGYVPQPLPGRTEAPLTVREVVAIGRCSSCASSGFSIDRLMRSISDMCVNFLEPGPQLRSDGAYCPTMQ